MWRDEVRAFSVATRAHSWLDLVNSLRVEAHPILWYAVLRLGYAATHSTLVLPVTSLAIAAGAAFLILRFAPFPIWARLLCVFGSFLGHEYSVVCRNYGIGILLVISVCVMFRRRHDRPLRVGLTLALLANTSVPAAIASLVLSLVWVMDLFQPHSRALILRPASMVAIGIAIGGTALAIATAHPASNMAYAFSMSQFRASGGLPGILMDPLLGLSGAHLENVGAAKEIPWEHFSLDPELISRLLAAISIVSIGWSVRRNRACLAGVVLATFGFEVLFRHIYTGSLRHDGILAFLLISLCWIACTEVDGRSARARGKSIALGLLPLLVTQAVALPVIARRDFAYPASSSKSLAELIRRTQRYRNAILIGEPDYMMEAMPYYVGNRIFMARQGEFGYRVFFDRGERRKQVMRLGNLLTVADSVSCANGEVVLLAIGFPKLLADTTGEAHIAYRGAVFRWDPAERAQLFERAKLIATFTRATSDENYLAFEIAPRVSSAGGCPPLA